MSPFLYVEGQDVKFKENMGRLAGTHVKILARVHGQWRDNGTNTNMYKVQLPTRVDPTYYYEDEVEPINE